MARWIYTDSLGRKRVITKRRKERRKSLDKTEVLRAEVKGWMAKVDELLTVKKDELLSKFGKQIVDQGVEVAVDTIGASLFGPAWPTISPKLKPRVKAYLIQQLEKMVKEASPTLNPKPRKRKEKFPKEIEY